MSKNTEKVVIGLLIFGIVCLLVFIGGTLLITSHDGLNGNKQATALAMSTATPTGMVPTLIMPTQTPVKILVTATPVPSATPNVLTPTPIMSNFVYQGIDLSSGLPTALTFVLSDGSVITSPWNRALAYKDTDNMATVFSPGADSIYTHYRDMVVTWLHSGTWQGRKIFATDLENYVRFDGKRTLTLEESQKRVQSLKTAKVYLCQLDGPNLTGEVCLPKANFPGKIVELMVVAGTVVPHEKVVEFEENAGRSREWLASNYPGSGFELLTRADSWMIKTCVNVLSGQYNDGTELYLYNRLAIGFVAISK